MSGQQKITVEEVHQLRDLRGAVNCMKNLSISTSGIKNLDDAKARIMQFIQSKPGAGGTPTNDYGLKAAVKEDIENRHLLTQKYQATQRFYDKLPKNYKRDLNQVFAGIDGAFEERKSDLKKSDCAILIAGEKASGKSSLVNLLLGVDLLPTSQLGASNTTCELRRSEGGEKNAYIYHRVDQDEPGRRTRKIPPEILDLSRPENLQVLKDRVMAEDEDGDSPYDRIEIIWPFDMLEEGLVIIDTPGIGGGADMSRIVDKYLSKSFGFIYVINTTAAGGVARDRLQSFLRLVINNAGEDVEFTPESTLFVANKWDHIPDNNKEDLKRDIEAKLSRSYQAFKRSQMCYMSITEAQKSAAYGQRTKAYSDLLNGIQRLLPETLRSRLNTHYRWLSSVLKRSMYSLKMSKVHMAKSKDQKEEEFRLLSEQMNNLQHKAQDSIRQHKSSVDFEAEKITKQVIDVMRSKLMTDRLFNWDPKDFPQGKDRKKASKEAMERMAERLTAEVNLWEKGQSIMHSIKDKLVKAFKRDFALMEDQMAKLEVVLLGGDAKTVTDLHKSIKKQAPVKQLWKKAKTETKDEDNVKGLGGAVSSAATLNVKKIKDLFKGYDSSDKQKTQKKMVQATELYIESILTGNGLNDKVNKYFQRFMKGIDQIAKMIPEFLKADRQMMQILTEEIQDEQEKLTKLFPELLRDCTILQSQLDIFFVNHIMKFDYPPDEVDREREIIGSGAFADVYLATIKDRGRQIDVALKVCRDPVGEGTVSDILLEDRIMRDLEHDNIVKYYGASYCWKQPKDRRGMQWIMIMERCKCTLKDLMIGTDNPGKYDEGSRARQIAMKTMADYALQIVNGLRYLHDKGFVHRDLKLENVLVTERYETVKGKKEIKKVVKLTDVGLTKRADNIAFSIVGSPVYMAPEVHLQTENYDNKADIFSFAIMLWEMWYGIDAADHIAPQLTGPIETAVKGGLRPQTSLKYRPPEEWLALIKGSWEYDPKKRPALDVHFKVFQNFLQMNA